MILNLVWYWFGRTYKFSDLVFEYPKKAFAVAIFNNFWVSCEPNFGLWTWFCSWLTGYGGIASSVGLNWSLLSLPVISHCWYCDQDCVKSRPSDTGLPALHSDSGFSSWSCCTVTFDTSLMTLICMVAKLLGTEQKLSKSERKTSHLDCSIL